MADDNILAGLSGFAQGLSSTLVPLMQDKYRSRLAQEQEERRNRFAMDQAAREREMRKVTPPADLAGELGIPSLPTDPEILSAATSLKGKQKSGKIYTMNKKTGEMKYVGDSSPGTGDLIKEFGEDKQPGDETTIRIAAQNLEKMQATARQSKNGIGTIDRALDLVDQGVTGKAGQAKAFIAPYAEALGIDVKNLNDAATFQALTKVITGPMRMDIIGPGPVSEYEQKLMQSLGGGGGQAQAAARELLQHYRKAAIDKINDYNSSATDASSLSPNFPKLFKQMELPGERKTAQPSMGGGGAKSGLGMPSLGATGGSGQTADDIFNAILNKRRGPSGR